jgi:phosphotriesterase-related protein
MIIRTISGDIVPEKLGRTNYHEHAFQISPLLSGDELDSPEKSAKEFARMAKSGFDSYVDATPIGIGRRPQEMLELSKVSGLQIVHATGVHKEAHYAKAHPVTSLSVAELTRLFEYEIKVGILSDDSTLEIIATSASEIKAGFIKFGISNEPMTAFENRALEAAATVSAQMGIAIMIHTDAASEIFTVLDSLESFGANLNRIVVAHIDRRPDPKFHAEIASRGAYLGYDGAGRSQYFPDEVLVDLFSTMVELGLASHVLLGADVARSSRYIEYGGGPGLEYLGNSFLPMLRNRTSDEIVNKVLTANPANWLAFNL